MWAVCLVAIGVPAVGHVWLFCRMAMQIGRRSQIFVNATGNRQGSRLTMTTSIVWRTPSQNRWSASELLVLTCTI